MTRKNKLPVHRLVQLSIYALVLFSLIVIIIFFVIIYLNSRQNYLSKGNYQGTSVPTSYETPLPTKTPNITTNQSGGWMTCLNENLNLQVNIPPNWKCEIDRPDPSEFNIFVIRPDGRYISFLDVYPTDYSFGEIPKSDEGYAIGKVTLGSVSKNIYFWEQRSALSPILESVIYNQAENQLNYLKGIVYINCDWNLRKLSSEDRNTVSDILTSVSLIN